MLYKENFVIDGVAVMGSISFLIFNVLLYKILPYLQHTGWTQTVSRMIDVDNNKSQTVLHTMPHTLMCLIVLVPPLHQVYCLHIIESGAHQVNNLS